MDNDTKRAHEQLTADFNRGMDEARGVQDATPVPVDHDATVPVVNVPLAELVTQPRQPRRPRNPLLDCDNGVDDRAGKWGRSW